MLTLPEVFEREQQFYAFMTFQVRMNQMQDPAEKGFPAIFQALDQQGIKPTGPAFYNYRRINMAETLDVEAGVPVARLGQDAEAVRFGTLPAGRPQKPSRLCCSRDSLISPDHGASSWTRILCSA